jgi:hypothetical protein
MRRAEANTKRERQRLDRQRKASERVREARYLHPAPLDVIDTARNADAYEDWINGMVSRTGPHALDFQGCPLPSEAFVSWMQRHDARPRELLQTPITDALEAMRGYTVRGRPVGERVYTALSLIGEGKSIPEVAAIMGLNEKTIDRYLRWANLHLARLGLGPATRKGPADTGPLVR